VNPENIASNEMELAVPVTRKALHQWERALDAAMIVLDMGAPENEVEVLAVIEVLAAVKASIKVARHSNIPF